jgi:uncharacterized protein
MAIRDNAALSRFELDVEGAVALAYYRRSGDVLTIFHTEVPRQLRERGIGSRLVQEALEAARAQGLKVAPRCAFVGAYMARHPEYHDLLA